MPDYRTDFGHRAGTAGALRERHRPAERGTITYRPLPQGGTAPWTTHPAEAGGPDCSICPESGQRRRGGDPPSTNQGKLTDELAAAIDNLIARWRRWRISTAPISRAAHPPLRRQEKSLEYGLCCWRRRRTARRERSAGVHRPGKGRGDVKLTPCRAPATSSRRSSATTRTSPRRCEDFLSCTAGTAEKRRRHERRTAYTTCTHDFGDRCPNWPGVECWPISRGEKRLPLRHGAAEQGHGTAHAAAGSDQASSSSMAFLQDRVVQGYLMAVYPSRWAGGPLTRQRTPVRALSVGCLNLKPLLLSRR